MTDIRLQNLILHVRLKHWIGDGPIIGSIALDGRIWTLVTMDVTANGLQTR